MIRTLTLLLTYVICAQTSFAQDRNAFLGAWELTKIERKDDQGDWRNVAPATTRFRGSIIYTPSGIMAAQLHLEDREAGSEILRTIPEYVNGYVAYYGTYSVDSENKVVTHYRRGHVNNDSVLDVDRAYIFQDDLLILSPMPERDVRLVWKKVVPE
jgi:hypothetical protein